MRNVFSRFYKQLCISMLLLAVISPASANTYPEMSLKLGHPYSDTHPLGMAAQLFADTVEKRSDGKLMLLTLHLFLQQM